MHKRIIFTYTYTWSVYIQRQFYYSFETPEKHNELISKTIFMNIFLINIQKL